MILPAIMSAPFLALGFHPIVVYNLIFVSAFWLSGLATYLLVERLTGSARAAFVAGLIYACASFRFDHYSHLELQMTWWTPLGLLALHRFLSVGRWVDAIACGVAAVAQLFSSCCTWRSSAGDSWSCIARRFAHCCCPRWSRWCWPWRPRRHWHVSFWPRSP
jgi:hypothetical protein